MVQWKQLVLTRTVHLKKKTKKEEKGNYNFKWKQKDSRKLKTL